MNMKAKVLFAAAAVVACASLSGCAREPTAEIKRFENDYPSQYQEILKPEVKNQADKFAMFRSYSRTYEIMDSVKSGKEVPEQRRVGMGGISTTYVGNGVTCYVVTGYQAVGISCVKQ